MQDTSFDMAMVKDYEYKIFWTISDLCNFHCSYCYRDKTAEQYYATKKYTVGYIADCFNKTGKSWLILLAGGEPFLMPRFLPLVKELTKQHHIQISSNLCSDDVFEFPDYAPPEKVMVIGASLHVEQREKVDPGFENFIEKYHFLEQKGYRVLVNYVAWPPLLNRIEKDFAYLKSRGVNNVTAFTFLGNWNGKYYPDSYTEEEIAMITRLSVFNGEEDILRRRTKYKGIPCEAGYKYFSMDIRGNITQCNSIKTGYGNLFDDSFKPDLTNKKCIAEECIDTYMGEFLLHRKEHFGIRIRNYLRGVDKNKT